MVGADSSLSLSSKDWEFFRLSLIVESRKWVEVVKTGME